jgi:signal transduction histidine kinase/ligand-binding sensor domain-containing protein
MLFMGISLLCNAQHINMKFKQLTVDDGLSSNRIWCIHRDSKDYLWICTDVGLDKYDSHQVKKYRNDEKRPGTISSNNVRCIFEDREKRLWFGSTNGLNLYNPAKDDFKAFKNDPSDKNSIYSNSVNSIIEDTKGNLWILTDGHCLNKWVPQTQNFIRYQFDKKSDEIYIRPARMMANDSKGHLWVASFSNSIYCFETGTEKFKKYDIPTINPRNSCYKSLYVDNQDKIWITTDGFGFFSFELGINKFEHYGSKGDGNGTNQNMLLDIFPEDNRHILLAVDQGGINRFDKISKTFEYITVDNGLSNNGIWCFHGDREGILWIGTSGGGINYYNSKLEKFKLFRHNSNNPKSLSYNFTGCFYEDHEGLIWVGTDGGGVNIFNPKTGHFTIFKHNNSDPYSISSDVIRSIAEDKDHDMWIGTWDAGLNRYDRKSGRFYHYMPDKNDTSSISGKTIWGLAFDHKGILWLSIYNVGTDLFDTKKGVIKRFRYNPNIPNSISSNESWLYYEDQQENMWICTENGLNLFDRKTNSFSVYHFPEHSIDAICRDIDGNLWLGSKSGIYYCKSNGTIIKTFNITNGLPNSTIKAIIEDKHGNIWISTDNGISRLDRKTKKFRNFTKEDGLQGDQFFQQSFLKTRKGEFYFGGYNGFNTFNPDSLKDNDFVPPVYITDFQIFNKPVQFGVQFPIHISEAKEIKLDWRQSVFSFSFAAINFTHPEKNLYAYIMKGFEADWNFTNVSRRYVTYTNLNPGEYTFQVKASNNDGVWNDEGVSLHIIILPPWWKTWWFKIGGIAILILLVYIFFNIKMKLYREKQIELSNLVKNRTQEITRANEILLERQTRIEEYAEEFKQANCLLISKQSVIEEQAQQLQGANLQLKDSNQQLKEINQQLAVLNSTKDRFFAIIAHDLRNPFHVVRGFTEILIRDYKQLPTEKVERFLNLIYASSTSGYNLLENLLQWSLSQTGRIPYDPAKLNLSAIAEETINLLEGDALHKNIKLQSLIDQNTMVFADENMLKTIFRNLVSNSIKFTPENGTITMKSTSADSEVEVNVIDTGIGIHQNVISQLFCIDETVTTKGTFNEKGTGLGLILCSEFVEKHNGKIWVESELNKGSTFKFTLPLA